MLVAGAQASFEEFLGRSRTEDADVADAVAAMIDWYALERATDAASPDDDGDMLLFQWGPYDWGRGRFFEADITRQLILASEVDDDAIMQLSFTFATCPGARPNLSGRATSGATDRRSWMHSATCWLRTRSWTSRVRRPRSSVSCGSRSRVDRAGVGLNVTPNGSARTYQHGKPIRTLVA